MKPMQAEGASSSSSVHPAQGWPVVVDVVVVVVDVVVVVVDVVVVVVDVVVVVVDVVVVVVDVVVVVVDVVVVMLAQARSVVAVGGLTSYCSAEQVVVVTHCLFDVGLGATVSKLEEEHVVTGEQIRFVNPGTGGVTSNSIGEQVVTGAQTRGF